ncbi:MAG TPA: hypothetical protein DCP91_05955 [Eggerthellaceae bacterium]|nr:hypothetical protein [Eggerthellaceae bacterium]
MSTIARQSSTHVFAKTMLVVLCVLCLQFLCGCAGKSGDEGVIDQAIEYANTRTVLDMAKLSVVNKLPDVQVEVSLLEFKDLPSGEKEIKLEPAVVSDTMASWDAGEWAANRDDLFFNLSAHFNVICKQAHEFGDVPEDYLVTCPDYMVVYDSQRNSGFIVSATGVYRKTDDPENPIGETIVLAS